MMRALLASIAVSFATPSLATGGFSCLARDEKAVVVIDALATRGMGSPVLRFDGRVELAGEDIGEGVRTTEFDSLAQYWSHDDELRLLAYWELDSTTVFSSVQLVVTTRFDEKGDLAGRYAIEIEDGAASGGARSLTVEGDITCMLE